MNALLAAVPTVSQQQPIMCRMLQAELVGSNVMQQGSSVFIASALRRRALSRNGVPGLSKRSWAHEHIF